MKVIVNATPIIAISAINKLELINQLFDEVIIPHAVYEEVVIQGAKKTGAIDLQNADWIQIEKLTSKTTIEPLLLGLDQGELEVIQLGLLINPDFVVIDEKLGRKIAQAMGLSVKGTLGILLAGFYAGYLSKQETLKLTQQLVNHGIRLSAYVIDAIKSELDNY
jgi:predicted nucleic acid-binding protein